MPTSPNRLRILIVDDHLAWRNTLRFCLMITYPNINIVGDASNGQSAIELCDLTNPDLVLIDINMPGMNGFETAKALLAKHPDLSIIGVSAEVNPKHNQLAKEAGFTSVIPKDMIMEYLPLTNLFPHDIAFGGNQSIQVGSS